MKESSVCLCSEDLACLRRRVYVLPLPFLLLFSSHFFSTNLPILDCTSPTLIMAGEPVFGIFRVLRYGCSDHPDQELPNLCQDCKTSSLSRRVKEQKDEINRTIQDTLQHRLSRGYPPYRRGDEPFVEHLYSRLEEITREAYVEINEWYPERSSSRLASPDFRDPNWRASLHNNMRNGNSNGNDNSSECDPSNRSATGSPLTSLGDRTPSHQSSRASTASVDDCSSYHPSGDEEASEASTTRYHGSSYATSESSYATRESSQATTEGRRPHYAPPNDDTISVVSSNAGSIASDTTIDASLPLTLQDVEAFHSIMLLRRGPLATPEEVQRMLEERPGRDVEAALNLMLFKTGMHGCFGAPP
jgi:hypothetical protein